MRIDIPQYGAAYLLDNESDACLAHGGRGSLKSTIAWAKCANRARHPGAVEGAYRKRLIDIKDKELPLLLQGIPGVVDPILPPGTYKHDKALKRIDITGGGSIVYNGFDQGEVTREAGSTSKTSGGNLTGAHIFEVVECTPPDVDGLDASVRIAHPHLHNQINMNCNPGPPSHWIADRFGLALGKSPWDGYSSWHMNPVDNPFVTDRHLRTLRRLTGVARARYLEGKWVGSDGLVYDTWDRRVHVVKRGDWQPAKRVILGCDEGYTDPFVVVRIELDANGHGTIVGEHYQSKMQRAEKIAAVRGLLRGEDAPVIVDSAAPETIEALVRAGVDARPANKGPGSVEFGIGIVQQWLSNAVQDEPGLRVSEDCTNVAREFETYEWAKRGDGLKDKPRDADNHAMDAIRYAIDFAAKPVGGGFLGPDGEWIQ